MAQVSFVKNLKDSVKEVKPVTFKDVEFEIRQFLPIEEKLELIEGVINSSFEDDKYDSGLRDIVFEYLLAKHYTNLKVEKNITQMYDVLKSSGLLEFIVDNIPVTEIDFLVDHIEDRLEEEFLAIERKNTFVNIVKKFLEDMNNSVPEMVKALEEFDPEKLSMIKGMLDFEKGVLNKKVKN